jgi:hypothetical protein
MGDCLNAWDIRSQKWVVRIGKFLGYLNGIAMKVQRRRDDEGSV